tara:strand:+ start:441 stop:1457 length:1017 start_codon:yes stop_codon:yes gene_type:complete
MGSASVGAVRILDQSGDNVADDSTGALKVKLVDTDATVTVDASELSVHLEAANDDVLIYGNDYAGSPANQKLKVDSSGLLYVKSIADAVTVNTISGFATEAKQPSLGTAGSASANVITVQGIASMTPLVVDLGSNNDVTLHAADGTALTETSGAINVCIQGAIGAVGTHGSTIGAWGINAFAEAKDFDGSALPSAGAAVVEGEHTRLSASINGVQYVMLVNEDGSKSPIDQASGQMITTHNITGMVSDRNTSVGTTAEQLNGATDNSMDVACKRVDLQASYDNTGYILIGDSGLAGNLSGGGIKLLAGDFYSIDIDNVGDIYVLAETDAEDIYYTYYT